MGVTLHSRLPIIAAEMVPKARTVVIKTVADIKAAAQLAAPVDTGALRNSIYGRTDLGALTGRVFTGMDYAPYVEYGTYKMGAQPYLVPAAEASRDDFVAAMKSIVR